MKISIDLDTADATDLAALTALVRSLGGGAVLTPPTGAMTPSAPPAQIVNAPESFPNFDAEGGPAEIVGAPEHIANPEGAPDVDSRGFRWDERIHAGTKATNADGTWRNKRGVDKALLDSVEAEMRAGLGEPAAEAPEAPTTSTDVPSPSLPELPEPPAPAPAAAAPSASDVPAAPTTTPDVAPSSDQPSFKDAMARVTAGQKDGSVTQQQVAEAAQALGLSSVVDLAKPANAHLIAGFIAALG